jgi:hypothetical protein
MAYKRLKDESKTVGKWKLKAGKKHYFHVFLWEDPESFAQNTTDTDKKTGGCVNLVPSIIEIEGDSKKEIVRPKLGEVHFIKDRWDMEIVAHELCHALIHRIRMIRPDATQVVEQEGDSEETICYEFGKWVDQIYRVLWEVTQTGSGRKSQLSNSTGVIMEEIEIVRQHMKTYYRVNLDDLEISDVPGYWRDRTPKMHKGHPLHNCLGCSGPFRATYTYFDNIRDYITGRFVSPYRTWRKIYNQSGVKND